MTSLEDLNTFMTSGAHPSRLTWQERGGQQRSNAAVVNRAARRATLQVGAALETSINETLAELSAPLLAPATDGRGVGGCGCGCAGGGASGAVRRGGRMGRATGGQELWGERSRLGPLSWRV